MINVKLFRHAALIITLSAVCVFSMGCSDNAKLVEEQSSVEEQTKEIVINNSNASDGESKKSEADASVITETSAEVPHTQETSSQNSKEDTMTSGNNENRTERNQDLSTPAADSYIVPYGHTKTLKGYQIVDGPDYPVTVTIGISDVQSGEDAYNILKKDKPDIPDVEKDMEYVIITVNVSYDDGELDVISLAENQASLDAAKLYFSLGNSEDVTNYLDNNIYNMSIKKGESVQGDLAFIHKKGNEQPLGFFGFDKTANFQITP